MLRSLVGSEMCIRDRRIVGLVDDDINKHAAVHLLVSPCGREIHVARHVRCLLYTSDAADDLLCVDLGGRRIIKKKTPYITILLI